MTSDNHVLNLNCNLPGKTAWQHFTELCRHPADTQQKLLTKIIKNATNSQIGRKYNFSEIKTIDDFRRKLPLTNWSDYTNYIEQMKSGQPDILFNGQPTAFIITSGTSGKNKFIPESKTGSTAKIMTDKLRRNFTLEAYPHTESSRVLALVNSASLGHTNGGTIFGTASGLTLMQLAKQFASISAFPLPVMKISDNNARDYAIMRFAMAQDVRFIVSNNIAGFEKLTISADKNLQEICRDIKNGSLSTKFNIPQKIRSELAPSLLPNPERAEKILNLKQKYNEIYPAHYWPDLNVVCCWLSGSVGKGVDRVKHLFPENVDYLDYGYGASEGKFNIPHTPGISAGPPAIHAAFYEFIPADSNSNETLLLHQLQQNREYSMIITTYAGLYRYKMHDIIRVDGFYKNTPEITFVSKTADIGNMVGEKLSAMSIIAAANKLTPEFGNIQHTCAVLSPDASTPYYTFYIEFTTAANASPNDIAEKMDNYLKQNIGYANKRRDSLLAPPKIKIMPSGWQNSLYAKKTKTGISTAQIKLPIIYNKTPPQ